MVSAISVAARNVVILVTALIVIAQLLQMKRATIPQAFSAVVSTMQAPEVRRARGVLMNIGEREFAQWERERKEAAEVVCSTSDVVGSCAAQARD